jgi:hypothetical protein
VTAIAIRDHPCLIDGGGNLVKNKNGGAAFNYAKARRYLEWLEDRRTPWTMRTTAHRTYVVP